MKKKEAILTVKRTVDYQRMLTRKYSCDRASIASVDFALLAVEHALSDQFRAGVEWDFEKLSAALQTRFIKEKTP